MNGAIEFLILLGIVCRYKISSISKTQTEEYKLLEIVHLMIHQENMSMY